MDTMPSVCPSDVHADALRSVRRESPARAPGRQRTPDHGVHSCRRFADRASRAAARAVDKADSFLAKHPETSERFDRVGELVEGFETPLGLELLATVHWVADNENAHTDQAIEDAFYAWNPQKAQFTPEQIAIAVARLRAGGWVRDDGPIQAIDTR
jgi:hypothetical protein